jgi:photosystem II stability/assembly factor-like uncharacterized protein
MKKFYILTIISLILSISAFSHSVWNIQNNSMPGTTFKSVYFVNNNTGWTVGNQGLVYKTTNGGTNWNGQTVSSYDLESVYFFDSNTGWIVGGEWYGIQLIMKTTNGGVNWIQQSTSVIGRLNSVYFTSNDTGWIAGNQGLLKTINGGTNWISQSNGIFGGLSSVYFIDQNTGWTSGGGIYKTINGGENWMGRGDIGLNSVHFGDRYTGCAVGNQSVSHTTNGGDSWTTTYPVPFNLNSVYFANNRLGWIVGEYGILLETIDGGYSWADELITEEDLYSVYFINPAKGWAVGENGLILSTVPFSNDVGVTSIIEPAPDTSYYVDTLYGKSINPKVNIENFGINNQNNFFDVHFEIQRGDSIVYSDTKQDTISYGQIHTINFNIYNIPINTIGTSETFTVKSWTTLSSDSVLSNNAEYSTFKVYNTSLTPLSGTYTIGSGGTYPTINSAFSDASYVGINGPVIFEIISGIYNEQVFIDEIPGSSEVNTVILKSQSGNTADVLINGIAYVLQISASNIIIDHISIGSSISNIITITGENISFTNNSFNNGSLEFGGYSLSTNVDRYNFKIIGNVNIGHIFFPGERYNLAFVNIQIVNNSINNNISCAFCYNVLIEKNSIGSGGYGISGHYLSGNIRKNIINGKIFTDGEANIYNNFISGPVTTYLSSLINNTIVGGSLDTPTVDCSFSTAFPFSFLNNIIINPSGGTAFYSFNGIQNSDYNDYYNGGNINLFRIYGSAYNNVIDYYNATGNDQHSNSRLVHFVSPVNLHLTGASIGDEQLYGIPNALVTDDIDGDLRNPVYPYKGADEADIPLPVELTSFTTNINGNDVTLNWQTNFETNNSGFDIERSITKDQWMKAGFVEGNGTTNTMSDYTFTDKYLTPGKYKYRLKQIDFNGSFQYFNLTGEVIIGIPDKYELSQNYPNPFNPSTVIRYSLTKNDFTSLKIYDITGKEVAKLVNQKQDAGRYEIIFNGSNLASGVYFYELRSGNFVSQKRMLLLK